MLLDCRKPRDIWIFYPLSHASRICKEAREKAEVAAEATVDTLAQVKLAGEAEVTPVQGVAVVDNLMFVEGLECISHTSTHTV